jgi:branched-chain amino acid transport system permease protein
MKSPRDQFIRQLLIWGGCALLLIVLPLVFQKDFALSLFSRMCIAVVFALSYNMLLGQGGMMSFGHAVYSGLGAYLTIHALNAVGAGHFYFPVTLLPLVGGATGLFFGWLLGHVSTKRAGTPFAMISLGIGELVAACALMLPAFFGGEAGISGDRVTGEGWFGIDYGSPLQMYGLIAAWTFACAVAMYALTHTPLGRMANAVRDNPERVQFIGYDAHRVRYYTLILSAFFAGIAGGLMALNYEIVTSENVSAQASGAMLLMAYIGGIGQFFGPVLGAVFFTFMNTALSSYTKAWPFYFGLLFLITVLYAPGGFSSLIVMHGPVWKARLMRLLAPAYALCLLTAAFIVPGIIGLVEMCYHLSEHRNAPRMSLFGIGFDASTAPPWIVTALLIAAGLFVLRHAKAAVGLAWQKITELLQRNDRARRDSVSVTRLLTGQHEGARGG